MLADPVGVVAGLLCAAEPGLDRQMAGDLVRSVAAGRAKRRRLAQALLDKPSLLADGRSPAPRVAADLLIALRRAGAVIISPPVCAGCGKQLRTVQRRGQDWYCGACGPRPEPCARCGLSRPVSVRDRAGRPHCHACQPEGSGRDPTAIVAGIIAVIPSVLRLIGALANAGAQRIIRPACPHCGRVIALVKPRDGVRLCRNCTARSRAVTCSRCGVVREAATRDEHGRPLCPYCLISDPANLETCISCGRRRVVSVRTPGGPLCPACRPAKTMICSICARLAPAEISKITGEPWCNACQKRRARCAGCGSVRPVRGGTTASPLCGTCIAPSSLRHACPGCGERTQHRSRRCARCSLRHRLDELLRDDAGTVHPRLQALHDNLAGSDRPDTVLGWLNKNTAAAILGELAAGERPLTHAALDELPDSKTIRHLRSVLVNTGALPPRDEHMIRLERWITVIIAGRDDPGERQLLHRYATWHALRRLRRRAGDQHVTHGQAVTVQRHVRAAITMLDWLTTRGLGLGTARQGVARR